MDEILKKIEEWESLTRAMKYWKTLNQESWNDGPFPVIEKLCQALRVAVNALNDQNAVDRTFTEEALTEISKILNCETESEGE